MNRVATLVFSLACVSAVGCSKSSVATVDFAYTSKPKVKLSDQHMNIAVIDARMEGDKSEFDEHKWSDMTGEMLRHYLEEAGQKNNLAIKIVDREHVKLAMAEKDLASAGITDSGDNVGAAKIKGAGAVLTSKVTIKIDKQVGKKRTVDAMSIAAGGWRHGGFGAGSVGTTEVDEEARNITVTCQFQLKDPATNEIIESFSSMPTQNYVKKSASPFFGSSKTEANMSPRDQVIGGMIERAVQQFLGRMLPIETRTTVQVKPSTSDESKAGTSALVGDNYEEALRHFKAAIAKDPNDHHSLFGAGVCCEKMKNFSEARSFYKRAQALKTKDADYADAVDRMNRMS